jgi:hypothetical protein
MPKVNAKDLEGFPVWERAFEAAASNKAVQRIVKQRANAGKKEVKGKDELTALLERSAAGAMPPKPTGKATKSKPPSLGAIYRRATKDLESQGLTFDDLIKHHRKG